MAIRAKNLQPAKVEAIAAAKSVLEGCSDYIFADYRGLTVEQITELRKQLRAKNCAFKVVKNNGGMSICVYNHDNEKGKQVAQKCFIEGRVNYFVPADYTEGSDLYELIKNYIVNVIETAKDNDTK